MTADSKESMLRRWSRRKLEARDALADDAAGAAPVEAEAPATPASAEGETDKPVLTDADMPPLESLTEESDFSPFMSEGVSDELRNLALRKLFRSSVFNIRDGLDEYDEDYTYFEKLGDIVTADMKHQIEMQQQKLREKLAAEGRADELEVAEGETDAPERLEDDLAEDLDDGDAVAARDTDAASSDDRDAPASAAPATGTRAALEKKS